MFIYQVNQRKLHFLKSVLKSQVIQDFSDASAFIKTIINGVENEYIKIKIYKD